jgi:urea transporter
MINITDIIGLLGVALLVATYASLQLDKIDPKGFWYSFNNLLVAILVTISLVYTPNIASIVIEVFWFLISLYGIVMYYKRKQA